MADRSGRINLANPQLPEPIERNLDGEVAPGASRWRLHGDLGGRRDALGDEVHRDVQASEHQ